MKLQLPEYLKKTLEECRQAEKKWVETNNRILEDEFSCSEDDVDLIYSALRRLTKYYNEDVEEMEKMYGIKGTNE